MTEQDDKYAGLRKTGFYGSGMKTTTPRKLNSALDETKEMEAIEETNTIRYNEPTNPFQMMLLKLFRSSVAKLNEGSGALGTPEMTGKALAELVKAADPEAQGFFNANYHAAFDRPDALYQASVGLGPALMETFMIMDQKKIRKLIAANKNCFEYTTSYKGVDVRFQINFDSVTREDKKKGRYNQILGHFQKMRQVAGGSMGGLGRAYDVINLDPAFGGGWIKKAKEIPVLDAMVTEPADYYDTGGVFLLSDIIHVARRLTPQDSIKTIAAAENNYERRNWILSELLSLPERLKAEYK